MFYIGEISWGLLLALFSIAGLAAYAATGGKYFIPAVFIAVVSGGALVCTLPY